MNQRLLWLISGALFLLGYLAFAKQAKLDNDLADLSVKLATLTSDLEKIKSQRARFNAPSGTDAPPAVQPENEAIIRNQVLVSSAELDDPFRGSKTAPVTIMVFNDYECQRCNAYSRILYESIYRDFSEDEVKLIYRDFPLDQHHWAKNAATVANCIGEQGKYWEAFEKLTTLTELTEKSLLTVPALITGLNEGTLKSCMSSQRYDSEHQADATDARQLGAKGAPGTFVALKVGPESYQGNFIRGAQPYELIREELLIALQKSEEISADKR